MFFIINGNIVNYCWNISRPNVNWHNSFMHHYHDNYYESYYGDVCVYLLYTLNYLKYALLYFSLLKIMLNPNIIAAEYIGVATRAMNCACWRYCY